MSAEGISRGYVVCSSPRSGSTYFLYLLRSTRVLGRPSEWLRGDGGPANDEFPNYTRDQDEQIQHVLTDGATPNGVYGLKMFPEHFDATESSRWASRLPNLGFIHLTREDLLDQALSLAIARQTHSYASWHPELTEPEYDFAQIRRCIDFIAMGEARWRAFFALNGIIPAILTYGDLLRDPQGCIDVVARSVGVEAAVVRSDALPTQPQRTSRNAEWRRRFLAESSDLDRLPRVDAGLTVAATLYSPYTAQAQKGWCGNRRKRSL